MRPQPKDVEGVVLGRFYLLTNTAQRKTSQSHEGVTARHMSQSSHRVKRTETVGKATRSIIASKISFTKRSAGYHIRNYHDQNSRMRETQMMKKIFPCQNDFLPVFLLNKDIFI